MNRNLPLLGGLLLATTSAAFCWPFVIEETIGQGRDVPPAQLDYLDQHGSYPN